MFVVGVKNGRNVVSLYQQPRLLAFVGATFVAMPIMQEW